MIRRWPESCSSSNPLQSRVGSRGATANTPSLMLDEPALRIRMASGMVLIPDGVQESVAGFSRRRAVSRVRPHPVADFRHVLAMLAHVMRMPDQGVAKLLFDM